MTEATAPARRWDPIVRITHWSIALAVLANALVAEEGSGPHIWVGYGLAAILGLRLVWGLIGPAEARLSAFGPNPRKALAHLRDIRSGTVTHYGSHNPLGALMVNAIWGCLLTIIGTGIAMAAIALIVGVVLGAYQVCALLAAARANAAAMVAAQGAMADLILLRFEEWRLTAAEADVALFALFLEELIDLPTFLRQLEADAFESGVTVAATCQSCDATSHETTARTGGAG